MNSTRNFMRLYNAKMEGVTVVIGESILTRIKGYDKYGKIFEFPATMFCPERKVWKVKRKEDCTNFYFKADFLVEITGNIEFQDENGFVCIPELVGTLIKTDRIYFFLKNKKYRVITTYKDNHFIVAEEKELCVTGQSKSGKETYILQGDQLRVVKYVHKEED